VQPRNAGHHGEPIVVFVLITVAAVAALLLMSMPRLRWWQQTREEAADAGTAAGLAPSGDIPPAAGLAPAAELAPAAVAAQPRQPEVVAEPRLAGLSAGAVAASGGSASGVSANGVAASGVAASGISASGVTPSLGARVEALARPLPAETMRPDDLLGAPVRDAPAGQAEPQAPSAEIRRSTLARPTPARSTLAPPASARPEDRSSDYGAAGPARSIVGSVPPAVDGQAPIPQELRWPAEESEHANTRPLPSDGRSSE
jgi:hypothetical protein